MTRRVLVIEDDQDIAHLLALNLQDICDHVDVAQNGSQGWEMAESGKYDLIILDLMLPGIDGLEICRRLRARPHYTPILMLTAKSSELDRVLGLELGADDYLTKPFSIMELLARVKAIFRRVQALAPQPSDLGSKPLQAGGLMMEVDRRRVTLNGLPVELTAKEFDLLAHFVTNPGRVYTRTQILDTVWGYGHDGYEHTVNSHINRLRAKIEINPTKPHYLLTVWGIGYKFTDAPAYAGEHQ